MNAPIKIVLYVLLILASTFFGKRFFDDYQRVNDAKQAALPDDSLDPMDVVLPETEFPAPVETPTDPTSDPATTGTADPNGEAPADPDTPSTDPEASATESTSETEAETETPPRLGFYGGGFCLLMLALGLLAAYDLSQYFGNRAVSALYQDDDPAGASDDEYENAENVWATGDYLEAVRLLREYLVKNPKQLHAALRIAEIYEKDLNNPLAAALEYEELLNKKLPRERWGWAAIHLANIYSGPLEKTDQAIDLLRRLESEYGETQAAEKARQRLAMIDGGAPPAAS